MTAATASTAEPPADHRRELAYRLHELLEHPPVNNEDAYLARRLLDGEPPAELAWEMSATIAAVELAACRWCYQHGGLVVVEPR